MSVIAVILATIVGYLVEWDMTKLVESTTIIAYFLISGIIASLVYGWKPRLDTLFDKQNRKEIYKKINEELKDSLDSLNGTLDRITNQYEINGKQVSYKHIYMNYKVFEGFVNSGDFNHIDHQLQQPIQDIYGKITIHNEYVKKIVELKNDPTREDEYVLILNENEKELLREIPIIMEKLKKYC